MNTILQFYLGNETIDTHQHTFTFDDIYWWSDDILEHRHSYIQWFFPLTEPSVQVPESPVLDEKSLDIIRQHPEIYSKLQRKAFVRMLSFFDLRYSLIFKTIRCKHNWVNQKPNWVTVGEYNHNYSRITRILKSLMLFGNTALAIQLHRCLVKANIDVYLSTGIECFSSEVRAFWEDAVRPK